MVNFPKLHVVVNLVYVLRRKLDGLDELGTLLRAGTCVGPSRGDLEVLCVLGALTVFGQFSQHRCDFADVAAHTTNTHLLASYTGRRKSQKLVYSQFKVPMI